MLACLPSAFSIAAALLNTGVSPLRSCWHPAGKLLQKHEVAGQEREA